MEESMLRSVRGVHHAGGAHSVSARNQEDQEESFHSTVSRLERIFFEVSLALDCGQLHLAIRLADRARRISPQNATCILLNARLLMRAGMAVQAAKLLHDVHTPRARIARAEALFRAGDSNQASDVCGSLLRSFAVDALEDLSILAGRLCGAELGAAFPGWIATNSKLQLVGEIRAGSRPGIYAEGDSYAAAVRPGSRAGFDSFLCDLPSSVSGSIIAFAGGRQLLGSAFPHPPDFRGSGWVCRQDRSLAGEARCDWLANTAVTLSIRCYGNSLDRRCAVLPSPEGFSQTFSIEITSEEQTAPSIEVSIVLPDGSCHELMGSPLDPPSMRVPRVVRPGQASHLSSFASQPGCSQIIDVVIPVYAGYDETLRCLASVLSTTERSEAQIVVVFDAGPDPALLEQLRHLSRDASITLLENSSNLGFPASVNRGMSLHPDRDVVLLNSDTEVFGDWLRRLKRAAAQASDIATVTPLGEANSLTDYLQSEPRAASRPASSEIDRVAREVNTGRIVDIPIGVGFCLYIKRTCLDQTGYFDEISFLHGYGEENDFCMRAHALGWRHVAAADVYVHHLQGKSFGRNKEILLARNRHALNLLYPGYEKAIADFSKADPLLSARRNIDIRRLLLDAGKAVLLVTLDLPGGVERHVQERRLKLRTAGHMVVILKGCEGRARADQVTLTAEHLGLSNLAFRTPEDADLLRNTLHDLGLSHIELHHFLGLPPSVLTMILELDVGLDVYIHDYSWICPRLTLLGGDGMYCGEPPVAECENCIRTHGTELDVSLSTAALRLRSARLFAKADQIIAPSVDASDRIMRHFPGLHVKTVAWEQAPPAAGWMPRAAQRASVIRVAMIGAISIQKGHHLLLACARDAVQRNLGLEFVVVGYTYDDEPLLETGRVFITGPYEEAEVSALLEREQCHVAFFASVTPETWCYSLTHAMDHRLPILAFNHGAIAERLLRYPAAKLMPLSTRPAEINDALLEFARKSIASDKPEESLMDQTTHTSEARASEELTSSVQVLSLPEGIYSFAVKGGLTAPQPTGGLALPALQIGPAPGQSAGTLEFLTKATAIDRWLAYETDLIVLRIFGGEAPVLLTSLRSPDSQVLNVDVRRLSGELAHDRNGLSSAAAAEGEEAGSLEVQILAHIRNVGDIHFTNGRAGWAGEKLWLEAFAVMAIGGLSPDLVEYRGATADGFESAWLSNQNLCGSRGAGLPIVGFAVRLKPEIADQYDCAYSGRFLSGAMAGPYTDGSLCSSNNPGDPLEGIELRIVPRHAPAPLTSLQEATI
jgi:GT2 family glycosyltransferase/glycosyltransferase involved in cell wall biosynthesis